MVDYWAYTNDSSYVETVQQALMAQVGPDNNYMPPAYFPSLGNDDQSFWALAVLAAVEYGFPAPTGHSSTVYLDLAEAVFNTQWPRWNTSQCAGGLKWQIFTYNAGYDYKNSISNGAFFQIAARLAHYTGNKTYVDWAEKSWNWMRDIGLIDAGYNVFDGTNDLINCSQIDHTAWSYNSASLLYGTAMMYNYTNGSELWENRTTGLVTAMANTFFSPYKNATNIMYEYACEPTNNCDNDQYSFKAYLARWMAKSSIVAPYIADSVNTLLTRSAQAAAQACSGGSDGTTCGQKWYIGGYDGVYGVGQELSALETVHSLLLLRDGVDATRKYPLTSKDVHVKVDTGSPKSTFTIPPKTSATAAATGSAAADTESQSGANSGYRASIGTVALLALPLAAGGGLGFGLVR